MLGSGTNNSPPRKSRRSSADMARKGLRGVKLGDASVTIKLVCVLSEVEKSVKDNGVVMTFIGADAEDEYVMVTAWNAEVESINQQVNFTEGRMYLFQNLVPSKQQREYNMGTVDFQLGFRSSSKVSVFGEEIESKRTQYFDHLMGNKFALFNGTFANADFVPQKPDQIPMKQTGNIEGTIASVGQLRSFRSKDHLDQFVMDLHCKIGKQNIQITFWNCLAVMFSYLLEGKVNSVVQFASVKSSGPEKFTFMKTSKIHLADPVVSSQNFIKTLQDAAESADDTVMSIVDLRLKVLSDPAITPTGFVTIASDGANKAQIFTGFKLKAGIDYEFSIHMAKIVFQDEVLSLTIPHEKNVVIHEDEKIDANLNPEELEYPSI